ncbi:hypothetical protein FOL46_002770 [Perkinsus olseni]|uniref:RRM domain-containing protein n=1 Tax=Perkinsus olseni TaxID=32597 RepID=A0A7J6M654_PEROL|nr:hypothetical protein FOL46_002770 [Perkinsus olseni]
MSTVDKLSMSLDDIVKSTSHPRTPSTGGRQRRSGGKGKGSGRGGNYRSQPYEVAKPPPESAESAERFARAMGVRPGKGAAFNTRRTYSGKGSGKGYSRESSGSCTIKITNIPDDLTWRDIKQSFGTVGPVEFCNVEESRRGGNQAIITFKDSRDAQTAIDNYDGGEMNGRDLRFGRAMARTAEHHSPSIPTSAFTPDSQPSDLLQEALRSGGGNNLDDYVDVKLYVKSAEDSERWYRLLEEHLQEHTPRGYIWQRDPPRVEVDSFEGSPYLTYGIHLRYGDALHDEWLLLSLLISLTRKYSEVACQVSDVDGDPLLIEAAAALPKWLSPENAGNRVWIHEGMLHICPKKPSEHPPDIKPLGMDNALGMVFDEDCESIAAPSVQRCIINKVKSAPWNIDIMHVRLLLPAVLAEQLIRQPQIISLLLDYLPPDRLAERGSSVVTESVSKGDLVTIQVSMTKLHYASLMGIKGRLRMPSRLAYGGHQMRSRGEENTVMLGRLVSLAAHCAVKANNRDTTHFEQGKGLLDRIKECAGEDVPLERFAKYDGPSDSDAWLTEAIEEAAKGEDGLTEEEQRELQDVSTRLNDLMGKASGILGIENPGTGGGDSDADDEDIDDLPDSDAEDDEQLSDEEMKRYMRELDEELRMSMGPEGSHVDVTDDKAVDREVTGNLMRSLKAEDRLTPGPTKLLLREARGAAGKSSAEKLRSLVVGRVIVGKMTGTISSRENSGAPSVGDDSSSSSPLRPLVSLRVLGLGRGLGLKTSNPSTPPRSAEATSERLRSQLLSVGERFIGFDKVIGEEAARRRTSEEHRITDLAETVSRLDKALSDEVRRRTESTNTLTRVTEQMANDMLEKLQNSVIGKLEQVTKLVENLALRTTTLERGMLQFRGELPSKLLVDASALQKEIRELGERMSSERQLWAERDRRLLERLEEIGTGLERRVANECTAFDQQTAGLDREVEALKKAGNPGGPDCRVTEEEQFRGFLLEELAAIKNGLQLETRARTEADDDIIAGVNQSADSLQRGMSATNPTLGGVSQATPLPDVLTTEQLKALVPGGDEMDDTAIELLKRMGNDILDKILSDAASVAKRRKEEAISLSSLEYALERDWGISIRDESSPFFCGERTQPKKEQQQQQDAKEGAAAVSTACILLVLMTVSPEGARLEDQVADAAGDESPLSVASVGEFVSDASTEPEMGESSHDAQEELGRAFEEQERRLERLLRDRVQLERACLAFLSSDMPQHEREDLLQARTELADLLRTMVWLGLISLALSQQVCRAAPWFHGKDATTRAKIRVNCEVPGLSAGGVWVDKSNYTAFRKQHRSTGVLLAVGSSSYAKCSSPEYCCDVELLLSRFNSTGLGIPFVRVDVDTAKGKALVERLKVAHIPAIAYQETSSRLHVLSDTLDVNGTVITEFVNSVRSTAAVFRRYPHWIRVILAMAGSELDEYEDEVEDLREALYRSRLTRKPLSSQLALVRNSALSKRIRAASNCPPDQGGPALVVYSLFHGEYLSPARHRANGTEASLGEVPVRRIASTGLRIAATDHRALPGISDGGDSVVSDFIPLRRSCTMLSSSDTGSLSQWLMTSVIPHVGSFDSSSSEFYEALTDSGLPVAEWPMIVLFTNTSDAARRDIHLTVFSQAEKMFRHDPVIFTFMDAEQHATQMASLRLDAKKGTRPGPIDFSKRAVLDESTDVLIYAYDSNKEADLQKEFALYVNRAWVRVVELGLTETLKVVALDTSKVDVSKFTMEHSLLGAAFPPSTPGLYFFPAADKSPPFKQYPMRPSETDDLKPQVQSILYWMQALASFPFKLPEVPHLDRLEADDYWRYVANEQWENWDERTKQYIDDLYHDKKLLKLLNKYREEASDPSQVPPNVESNLKILEERIAERYSKKTPLSPDWDDDDQFGPPTLDETDIDDDDDDEVEL